MAIDNTNFPLSNFPSVIGVYPRMSDISADTLTLVNQYNTFLANNDYTSALNLYNANIDVMKPLIINAWVINVLQDEVRATQTYVKTFEEYVREIVVNRGIYSPTEKYVKFNLVSYMVGGVYQTYECTNDATPIGTLPTNTSFWVAKVIRGEQGVSGTGLSPRGQWNNTTTYYVNDFVVYNNVWWSCQIQNIGSTPNAYNANWLSIFDFTNYVVAYNNANSTLNATTVKGAIDELDAKVETKNNKIKFGNVTLSTTWTGTAAPYYQVVSVSSLVGVNSTSNLFWGVEEPIVTDAQITQFADAKIVIHSKATNSITFKALGAKNTISIPLSITNLG